eukprot:SAG11_NODE_2939_length_2822_cov_79.228792_2_plen_76_part_00
MRVRRGQLPDSTADERSWAVCMVLSRALLSGAASALEPFVDLVSMHITVRRARPHAQIGVTLWLPRLAPPFPFSD